MVIYKLLISNRSISYFKYIFSNLIEHRLNDGSQHIYFVSKRNVLDWTGEYWLIDGQLIRENNLNFIKRRLAKL